MRKLHYCAYSTFIFEVTHEEITLTCRYIYLYICVNYQIRLYSKVQLLKMKAKTSFLFRALTNIGNNQLYSISSRNSVHSWKQQVRQISQSSSSSAIPNIHEVHQEKVQPKIVIANPNHVLKEEIHKILSFGNEQTETSYILSNNGDIHEISKYYFDGRGKGIRPRICLTLAEAVNFHLFGVDNPSMVENVMTKQQRIAQISEMYHTGSLYHDDVIDKSEERRSQPSVNLIWGSKRSVMSGDYVVSMANKILADLDNDEVSYNPLTG